jgi:hypothetical protein
MIQTEAKTQVTAEQARLAAQNFVADHVGDLVGVGQPCRMVTALSSAWVVPLVLTSPGYGIAGVVGVITVDHELGYIVGWTPVNEIRANAEHISREKEAELEAAFQALRSKNQSNGHS